MSNILNSAEKCAFGVGPRAEVSGCGHGDKCSFSVNKLKLHGVACQPVLPWRRV